MSQCDSSTEDIGVYQECQREPGHQGPHEVIVNGLTVRWGTSDEWQVVWTAIGRVWATMNLLQP